MGSVRRDDELGCDEVAAEGAPAGVGRHRDVDGEPVADTARR